jgi:uncharacterized protein (DUF1810 family)
VISGDADAVGALTFGVRSLEEARAFLQSEDLLGESRGPYLTISQEKLHGLDFRIVQESS